MQTSQPQTLILVASRREAEAVLAGLGVRHGISTSVGKDWVRHEVSDRVAISCAGVGKANAAGAAARLIRPGYDSLVLSAGICGSLRGSGLANGCLLAATHSCYADEGLLFEAGFLSISSMGFPLGNFSDAGVECDARFVSRCQLLGFRAGPIATVSTCSGTDAAAEAVVARTGALAEAMEGAAVGQVCVRLGVGFAELRSVSNTTGDRARQVWDLERALSALTGAFAQLRPMFSD